MLGMDDDQGGLFGLLSKMFASQGAAGGPMQILPQVQQDAQNPSLITQLQGGLNKNAEGMYGLANGLLNQKPAAASPAPQFNMKRPTLPFSMAPAPMKWGQ